VTTETLPELPYFPLDDPHPDGRERSVGPRVRSEVQINPETNIEPYDYGTGCHLWIGVPFQNYVMVQLGYDEASRRDACDRLIAALTTVRDYVPTEPVE
jgi:hypothetical protein